MSDGAVMGWVERTVLDDGRWDLAPAGFPELLATIAAPDVTQLRLLPRRQPQHVNSTLLSTPPRGQADVPGIYLHPLDAFAAGVGTGDEAVVESKNGQLTTTVRIDDTLAPGFVSIPHGWSTDNVECLLSAHDDVDLLTGMPQLSGVAVRVRRSRTA